MAKSSKSKKGKKGKRETPAESVRSAVERTFEATAGQARVTRERAQELVDELSSATTRVREALDDMRLATGEDVKELQAQVAKLERRVAALEKSAKPAPARPTAAGRKPAAGKPAARKAPVRKPAS